MKFTVDTYLLKSAFSNAGRVLKKSGPPILQNFLMEAEGDELTVTATCIEETVRVKVLIQCEEPGVFTLPAAEATALVNRLSAQTVTISKKPDDAKVEIKSGGSKSSIPTLLAEDFPELKFQEYGEPVEVESEDLKRILSETVYATSSEKHSRTLLTGVMLETKGTALRAVATDTHRLPYSETPIEESEPKRGVVPDSAILALIGILNSAKKETVQIVFGESSIRFTLPSVEFSSGLLSGTFPNYEKVIPKNAERKLTVNRKALADAVARTMVFITESTEVAKKVKFSIAPSELVLSTGERTSGNAEEVLEADYNGSPIEMALNSEFLSSVIGQWDCESVLMEINGPLNPIIVRPSGRDDALTVIMPMAV